MGSLTMVISLPKLYCIVYEISTNENYFSPNYNCGNVFRNCTFNTFTNFTVLKSMNTHPRKSYKTRLTWVLLFMAEVPIYIYIISNGFTRRTIIWKKLCIDIDIIIEAIAAGFISTTQESCASQEEYSLLASARARSLATWRSMYI